MAEFIMQANQQQIIELKDVGYTELVRCKDCMHYRYYGLSEETVSECKIDHCENPDADWFCADGERKSTDEILMEEMDADPLG